MAPTYSTAFYPRTFDQSAAYFSRLGFTSQWTLVADTNAYRGSYDTSTIMYAASLFTGVFCSFGLIFEESPAGGQVRIYVDNVVAGLVSLYAPSTQELVIPFQWGLGQSVGTHQVQVELIGAGSGGGTTVAFDGFTELAGS